MRKFKFKVGDMLESWFYSHEKKLHIDLFLVKAHHRFRRYKNRGNKHKKLGMEYELLELKTGDIIFAGEHIEYPNYQFPNFGWTRIG